MGIKVKGLDNGYLYTKDNEHRIFKSAYSLTNDGLSNRKIIIDGTNYFFGSGNTTADVNKIMGETNKVCTLANLALSGNGDYNIVAGLPIVQYKDNKRRFAEEIMSYNDCEVIYKREKLKFKINNVLVYPQGAGALFTVGESGNCIIIDIGSFTINIAMFEKDGEFLSLTKTDTIYSGVIHLYDKVIKEVNRKYDLSLNTNYAERILKDGLEIYGMSVDTSFLTEILIDYLKPILNQIKTSYPYQIMPIYLCGGGGLLLKDILEYNMPNIKLIENSQFANAEGFYRYGISIWG